MKRTKFIFTEDYQRAVDAISDNNTKAELLLAINDYGINGNEYQGNNEIVKVAMSLIMPRIDRQNRRYEIMDEKEEKPASSKNEPPSLPDIPKWDSTTSFINWLTENAPEVFNEYHDYNWTSVQTDLLPKYGHKRLAQLILLMEATFENKTAIATSRELSFPENIIILDLNYPLVA